MCHGKLDLDILFINSKVNSTNRVFLLKNTLCTLCLRVLGFHAMFFFNCNIFAYCLVVSQTLGESALVMRGRSGGVSSAWWHMRADLRFTLWD